MQQMLSLFYTRFFVILNFPLKNSLFVKLTALPAKRFHSKLAALRAAEKFALREYGCLALRWIFQYWRRRREEKKRVEENVPCDNHNSHMFHSVDFRLLRLMFTVNSRGRDFSLRCGFRVENNLFIKTLLFFPLLERFLATPSPRIRVKRRLWAVIT